MTQNSTNITIDVQMPANSWLGLTLGRVAMSNVDMVIFNTDGRTAKVVDA